MSRIPFLSSIRYPLIAILAVFVLCTAALLVNGWLYPPSAPLKNAVFLIGDKQHRSLGYFDGTRMRAVSYDRKNFFEIARHDGDVYAILEDDDGSADIFKVGGPVPVPVTHDGKPKRDLSLSEDGRYIAFSYVAGAPDPALTAKGQFDIAPYTLAVFDTEDGSTKEFGNRAHPNFLGGTRLFCISAEGFETLDIVSGERSLLPGPAAARSVLEQPVMGADGMFLMSEVPLPDWRFGLFRITSTDPLRFDFVASLVPPNGMLGTAAAFDGDRAYLAVVSRSDGMQKVFSRAADGTLRPILTLPADTPQIRSFLF